MVIGGKDSLKLCGKDDMGGTLVMMTETQGTQRTKGTQGTQRTQATQETQWKPGSGEASTWTLVPVLPSLGFSK